MTRLKSDVWTCICLLLLILPLSREVAAQRGAHCGFGGSTKRYWSNTERLPVQLHSNIPKSWVPALDSAIVAWNGITPELNFYRHNVKGESTGRGVVIKAAHSHTPEAFGVTTPAPQGNGTKKYLVVAIAPGETRYQRDPSVHSSSEMAHLYTIAVHELGHCIVLSHNRPKNEKCPLMNRYYDRVDGKFPRLTVGVCDSIRVSELFAQ